MLTRIVQLAESNRLHPRKMMIAQPFYRVALSRCVSPERKCEVSLYLSLIRRGHYILLPIDLTETTDSTASFSAGFTLTR